MSPFADLNPPYSTIVADPPWLYTNTRGTQTRATAGRRAITAEGHYSTMSNEKIASLPIGDLAAASAHLYLWVTNPCMFGHQNRRRVLSPIEMVEGWGFTYITLLTWVKTGAPGLGFYFRGHTEHVIFAVRGRDAGIPTALRSSNVVTAPRRGHSEKPDAFFDLVEKVSPGPRLELFARSPRLGWDSWGKGYELGGAA